MRRWPTLIALPLVVACAPASEPAASPRPGFVLAVAGIDFIHVSGATGRYHFPEIAGSGCAWIDYDDDGDLDAYLVQAHDLDDSTGRREGNRLYRNDLIDPEGRRGPLRFTDVTTETGVGDEGYGMGVATGDIDGDGDLDLFVTNFGPDVLYRNEGAGTFTDVTTEAFDIVDDRWTTSATFFDADRDGDLDLYVCAYVSFSLRDRKICHSPSGRRDYCGPQSFDPLPDRLYRNRGDGTFEDITTAAGISAAFGSGLGVVATDVDDDGWPDLYVANDGNANLLWMNLRDGTFENRALLAGAAYNASGLPEAGMGVTAGDFDRDGDEDLFLTHLVNEHNTLLVNDGRGNFSDRTEAFGLATTSWGVTGFATRFLDVDLDGHLDLLVVNGAVKLVETAAVSDDPYAIPDQLWLNQGPPGYRFQEASSVAGDALTSTWTSRGAAFGDVDLDGDIDLLINQRDGPTRLLRNTWRRGGDWITLELRGATPNTRAVGAVVTIRLSEEDPPLRRRVGGDGSYLAANDLRLHVGLGRRAEVVNVTVAWPTGHVGFFEGLATNRQHLLHEQLGAP